MLEIDYYSIRGIGVSVEWVTPDIGFIRGGDGWSWGEPYQFTCLIIKDGEEAEIKGYLGYYSSTIRKAIYALAKRSNIKKIKYERMNQKTRREKEIPIT